MRAERLRRTKDIEIVRQEGALRTGRHFTIRARANGMDHARVAVASPRSIGTAVKRNRARRRVREALRDLLRQHQGIAGADIFVVTRASALDAAATELREALSKELEALLGPARA